MTEKVNDEMLMALADDELPPDEEERLRALVAGDPALSVRYAVFARTRQVLQAAYGRDPVPEHLVQAVRAAPAAPAGDAAPDRVVRFTRRRTPPVLLGQMAAAAMLALAVGVSGFLLGRGTSPLPERLAAAPEAAAVALAETPTGGTASLGDGRTARALASFDTDLGLCRMIAVEGIETPTERLVACRADAEWQVVLSATSANGAAYLPASDLVTATIDTFLDGIAAGAPLDLPQEAMELSR